MRSFRRGRPTIGLLAGWQAYPGIVHSFLEIVYRGASAAAADYGCNLLIGCGVQQPLLSETGPAMPLRVPWADFIPIGPWNTDGLVAYSPFTEGTATAYFQGLIDAGFPVVYGGDQDIGPTVIVDNEGGMMEAVAHLAGHGRQRIAFIAGFDSPYGDSPARLRGYRAGLERAGLPFDPALVAHGNHTTADSFAATRRLLRAGVLFDALIGSNDDAAVGGMQALREAGLRIPQDVAVIGFDDREEALAQTPRLSTVHYPMFEMGYHSVELLLEILHGRAASNQIVRIPTHLVVRESCGCLLSEASVVECREDAPAPQVAAVLDRAAAADEAIVTAMAAPVALELHRMERREVQRLCRNLLSAFRSGLRQPERRDFQHAIQAVLERVAVLEDQLHPWQAALSALDTWLPRILADLPAGCETSAEQLLHQARIAISEMQRGTAAQHQVHVYQTMVRLSAMTAQFFTAEAPGQIYDGLREQLPGLGARAACIVFYEAEGDDPFAASLLQFSAPEAPGARPPRRFATRSFPPPGLLDETHPFQLCILPLAGSQGLRGYIAIDTADRALLGLLTRQLTGALRAADLYQDALRARQAAEDANALKSRFLSMVSHELRTPLNLIFGLSNLLLNESRPLDEQEVAVNRKDLERIYIGAQHLESLIRDVLDLASSDVGRLSLSTEPVDLLSILRDAAELGEKLARDKDLLWETALPPSLPAIHGDSARLRQVVLNLIYNAVKFTSEGRVRLSAGAAGGLVTVAVSDTGLGIPPDEQRSIFDEFRRSDRSTARGFGGLGLGLAISKRLVELHGGSIDVISSGEEGEGSTFFLQIPSAEESAPTAENAPAETGTPRVLLLVSDLESGLALQSALAGRGSAVTLAAPRPGEDWLTSIVLPNLPEQIVLDLDLAAARGAEILRALREHPATFAIPLVFQAVRGDSGALLDLNFLAKPLRPELLAEALQARLETQAEHPGPILVVDDDPEMIALHTRLIAPLACGRPIRAAADGRAALELIRQEPPALVLLDLMMPEVDGFTVLETMQSIPSARAVPVIVLTSQVLTEEDLQRLNGSVTSVLAKGMFSADETVARIQAVLERKRRRAPDAQRVVYRAMGIIHARFAEPLTRAGIAAAVGLSERHLTRTFQQETGLTPMVYLNRYRVRQACRLLRENGRSITEIALDVGFSNSGYFTRVFKEETGLTPRAYAAREEAVGTGRSEPGGRNRAVGTGRSEPGGRNRAVGTGR